MRPAGCFIIAETEVTVALRRVEGGINYFYLQPGKVRAAGLEWFITWLGGTMGQECGCLCQLCVIVLILTQAGGGL